MATFGELDRYLDPGLDLTVKGTVYTVPLPSGALGLWCQRIAHAAGAIRTAETPEEVRAAIQQIEALPEMAGTMTLPERVLGEMYGQLVADAVEHPYIQFCGETAFIWIVNGEDAARRHWESGGRPEASGPANRQARRASIQTTGTGEASGTKPPGFSSGTNSRRKSPRRGGARRSRGSKS